MISATDAISLLIVAVSLAAWRSERWFRRLAFSPYAVANKGAWYQWLTSLFVHADMWHLLVNVFVFYSFGREVERIWMQVLGSSAGRWAFVGLFAMGGVLSEVDTYLRHRNNPRYLSVGASGAVAAVLFSAVMWAPWASIYIWGVLPLPAVVVGAAYLGFSAYMARRPDQYVNHSAHFWGGVVGILYTAAVYPPVVPHFFRQLIS